MIASIPLWATMIACAGCLLVGLGVGHFGTRSRQPGSYEGLRDAEDARRFAAQMRATRPAPVIARSPLLDPMATAADAQVMTPTPPAPGRVRGADDTAVVGVDWLEMARRRHDATTVPRQRPGGGSYEPRHARRPEPARSVNDQFSAIVDGTSWTLPQILAPVGGVR